MKKYIVKCPGCGEVRDQYALHCPDDDALPRTEYFKKQIVPADMPGMWRYYDWLPVNGIIEKGSGRPVTYKSEGFAKELRLSDLNITFNGYWPENEGFIRTCSFKDLESFPTMQRLLENNERRVLVVASAGNTARAFAHVASITGYPLLLIVPKNSTHRLWTTEEDTSSVCTVTVDGDYYQAIAMAEKIAARDGFVSEGGARNVARRDGMGTVMLDAVLTTKSLPQHYFQAVGSGTGGISAWEAAMRLIEDGRFGNNMPRLHLAQNLPCAPLYSTWTGEQTNGNCPEEMYDDVLFNRKPPYLATGGVKDALDDTNGIIYGITNKEADEARKIFEENEGIDILPAPAIACAAIMKALEKGEIKADENIVLNITGGGQKRLEEELPTRQLSVDLALSPDDKDAENKILEKVAELLKNGGY
ncbi:cysteate synthase [Methanococcoides burtonii]|uniref:Cysteate synthase n=1 Tax=Methanococcoides burtonii (strain DSM 6242 / NBRC 107633 / OCM 468 / ACE-M) TaxID=259564 RepID=CYAS_METBU|nr:cysteate synthase [Methanococcoides burtonii]Q12W15.1 RecName: Full=Cysteate synthase; Short=CS; Short=Cya synthase [Methanococcoides burtonii DSM 6242]ABE52361.1 Threonine synthase [Methanococcoides burtonii DSM 6242]